jgi:hypothetical protein
MTQKEMDVGSEHESLLLSAPLCMFVGHSRHISLAIMRGAFPSCRLTSTPCLWFTSTLVPESRNRTMIGSLRTNNVF